MNDAEIWKDISGYEGLYQISNKGNVKSLPRIYYSGRYFHNPKQIEEHLRRFTLSPNGYYVVILGKNGIRKGYSVHSL
ncbi:MAG: NUMOD4 domain-containing protein, partial [Candidatus Amoebophilus sp.]